ncbi:acyl carrier protein [Streptomyces sp. NPDC001890]|uniref:acyl carrier protein n=1 Tax=Streptomyces sp. NPDC001890 TaxID=3364620 RepID=UPI0036ADDBA7
MPQHTSNAPSTAAVLRIVADVLDVPELTADANFYDYGGSSLQAMRVCARLGKDLGVRAAPEALFETDTLGDFAAALGA